ncbi:EAL domain-containing protein [Cytobacillus sp. FJAT-53684]|uniref:EAL domain-containing protein n=1 Tax=Cytobacillus mangrovibacter TaxID=3299024 RepID=A0ABW6K2Z3_9BACI
MKSNEKINLLLVDDRPENLLTLEAIIEREEYNLIKAFSGEEALKHLLKYDFAAILLDVQMPGIDGFGTAKIIKAREKTKNIPILFITANNLDSEHIFTGYSIGAIDYILKPFDPVILKAKVEGFVQLYKMKQLLIQQAEDLTEKKRELEKANSELSNMTAQLRISEELANVINETSIDSMIIVNQDGVILKVNPAAEKMFKKDKAAILGENITTLFTGVDTEEYINSVLSAVNHLNNFIGYEKLDEVILTLKDGTAFPAEVQIGKRWVHNRCFIACTIRDITNQKQYQEKITYMAYHDGLTELPNRRFFNDQLILKINHARQTNQTLTVMYLDMDRFKYINDSLGHIIGDKVLQEIAKRIKDSVQTLGLVARVGGDEFNILLPNTDREHALEIAGKILEVFKAPFYIDSYELFITVCIGISIFPYDGGDEQMLMKSADAALYRAKEQGKNQYRVYHSGMDIQSYRSFMLQNDLRKAIEREEFTLVFQPRVDIDQGTIKSAEALIRWEHLSWGTLSPSEFIPLAEETGQIVKIGEWVLRNALQQSSAWQKKGLPPIRVAVNFSAQQFLQKDLYETINGILIETNFNPELLEIEITESILMGNQTTITKTLNQLRKLGVHISIDDFGTGYSSLNYLRRFPVDTIKIDRSFIKDISTLPKNNMLISTIISLADSLNMSVVAEGVETIEQLNILRKYNCKVIQGYLFSPPLSPLDFESFLQKSEEKLKFYTDNQSASIESKNTLENNETSVIDYNKEVLSAALNHIQTVYSLSTREMDVFELIVKGLTNKEISDKLYISEHTVKNHITRIFQKLTVNDRLQAMAKVYQTCIEQGKNITFTK